jgi:hypothetical protein
MRIARAVPPLAIALIGFTATGAAMASRRPSLTERAGIARAVLLQLEHDAPTIRTTVDSAIKVSTVAPGSTSTYVRFALAGASGVDASGQAVQGAAALVGFSRHYHQWFVLTYGSDLGLPCNYPQAWFGGRRSAILADLGVRCRS